MTNVHHIFAEPDQEALEILIRNFDVSDVTDRESRASLEYNLQRIEAAERDIQAIADPKERRKYSDWLRFFRFKTEQLLA